MGFFGSGLGVMSVNNASPISIGFSIVVVVIAALNLVLDFDFIEEGAEKRCSKIYGMVWSFWTLSNSNLALFRDS